jgi:hypothetical protein
MTTTVTIQPANHPLEITTTSEASDGLSTCTVVQRVPLSPLPLDCLPLPTTVYVSTGVTVTIRETK